MLKGIGYALSACFVWGWIFIIPQCMSGFSSIEVALGRNLFYGIVSSLIFCKSRLQGSCNHPREIWFKALHFSLVSTIGYYTCVVLALRYASPAICVLILGISPITISFYGNWKQKETSYKSLLTPSILVFVGLGMINFPYLEAVTSIYSYILGVVCSFISLAAWSWYVVANMEHLKKNLSIQPADWTTLMGVSTLFWVFLCTIFLGVFFSSQFSIEKYLIPGIELTKFLIGSAILGIICSWVGAFLWNKACLFLPITIAGHMTIFETIFGVLFVYLLESRMPPTLEVIGLILLMISIVWAIMPKTRDLYKQI